MNLAVEKRLKFIESRLFWEGKIRRKNLEDFFKISTPQATKDIKKYGEFAPDNLAYDTKKKQYVVTGSFNPHFEEPTAENYLGRLLHLKRKSESGEFFCGSIVGYEQFPKVSRHVDRNALKKIVEAIRYNLSITIKYQSMSRESPSKRWIAPHSLAYDGNRWHIRAFCYKKKIYCDFNIGRVLKTYEYTDSYFDKSLDYAWNSDLDLVIAPHPALKGGKRSCVELDYDMRDGKRMFSIKAAFYFYAKQLFSFEEKSIEGKGEKQQIILTNHKEVEMRLSILEEMNDKAIAVAISEGAKLL
jgi:hypothetical protein